MAEKKRISASDKRLILRLLRDNFRKHALW